MCMYSCKFNSLGMCHLITAVRGRRTMVPISFCNKKCDPNSAYKQSKMLLGWKIEVKDLDKLKHYNEFPDDLVLPDVAQDWLKYRKNKEKIELRKNQALNELPSKYQQAKNVINHAIEINKYRKLTGIIKTNEDVVKSRLEVCSLCEKMKADKSGKMQCSLRTCGCYLEGENGRVTFEVLSCDIGKHSLADSKYIPEENRKVIKAIKNKENTNGD